MLLLRNLIKHKVCVICFANNPESCNKDNNTCSIPPAATIAIIGVKHPAIKSNNREITDCCFSAVSSAVPVPGNCAYTLETSGPIITWNCPFPSTNPVTPRNCLIPSASAFCYRLM